jgi:hypothetical protein
VIGKALVFTLLPLALASASTIRENAILWLRVKSNVHGSIVADNQNTDEFSPNIWQYSITTSSECTLVVTRLAGKLYTPRENWLKSEIIVPLGKLSPRDTALVPFILPHNFQYVHNTEGWCVRIESPSQEIVGRMGESEWNKYSDEICFGNKDIATRSIPALQDAARACGAVDLADNNY